MYIVHLNYEESNPIMIAGRTPNHDICQTFDAKEDVEEFLDNMQEKYSINITRVFEGEEIAVNYEKEEYTVTKYRTKIIGI